MTQEPARVTQLKAMLAAREGKAEFKENVNQIRAELIRITKGPNL